LPFVPNSGNEPAHAVIEVEFAPLPQLRDGHRAHRLDGRKPQHQRVGRHRHAASRFTKSEVGHHLTAKRYIDLRADVQAFGHALCYDFRGTRQYIERSATTFTLGGYA
jgi:hypothetical protein